MQNQRNHPPTTPARQQINGLYQNPAAARAVQPGYSVKKAGRRNPLQPKEAEKGKRSQNKQQADGGKHENPVAAPGEKQFVHVTPPFTISERGPCRLSA